MGSCQRSCQGKYAELIKQFCIKACAWLDILSKLINRENTFKYACICTLKTIYLN